METDLSLINKVKKEQDVESLNQLIDRHSGIYVEIVNKYLPNSYEGLNKNDVLEDKNFCIYDAAIKFDEKKKTKFSTYIGNLARWKCLNIYNKKNKFPQISINEFNGEKSSQNSNGYKDIDIIDDQKNLNRIKKIISECKDERAKVIFKMRYFDDKKLTPWKKIAKKLDLSIQGCINIHNKHLTEIKKYV